MSKLGKEPAPQERLIVALDVPSTDEALQIVSELEGTVSFYKVGLELLMAGGMERLLRELVVGKKVFVDLKLPSDIPETVRRVVDIATRIGVNFLTLSNSATATTIRAAVEGRGNHVDPKLLFVPFLSSLDRADFAELYGDEASNFETFLQKRTASAKAFGADGFIVSGPEIGLLRRLYPDVVLVSPGIRPAGSKLDDHKRTCTPGEAIAFGADYIVVGRPIRNAADRKVAAQSIIDEIASASSAPTTPKTSTGQRNGSNGNGEGYSAGSSSDAASISMLAHPK